MQRLSDMLTRWLGGDLRPTEEEPEEEQERQAVGGEPSQPSGSEIQEQSGGEAGQSSQSVRSANESDARSLSTRFDELRQAVHEGTSHSGNQGVGNAREGSSQGSESLSLLPDNVLGSICTQEESSATDRQNDSEKNLKGKCSVDVPCTDMDTSEHTPVTAEVGSGVEGAMTELSTVSSTGEIVNPVCQPVSSVSVQSVTPSSQIHSDITSAIENQDNVDSSPVAERDGGSSQSKPVSVLSSNQNLDVGSLPHSVLLATDVKPVLVQDSKADLESATAPSECKPVLNSTSKTEVPPSDLDSLTEAKSEKCKVSEIIKPDTETVKLGVPCDTIKSDTVSTKSDTASESKESDMAVTPDDCDTKCQSLTQSAIDSRDTPSLSSPTSPVFVPTSSVLAPVSGVLAPVSGVLAPVSSLTALTSTISASTSSQSYTDPILEPGTSSVHTRLEPVISLHYSSQGTEASTIRVGFAPFDVQGSSAAIAMHNDLNDSSSDSRNNSTTDSSPELPAEEFDFHLPGDRACRREGSRLSGGKEEEPIFPEKQKQSDKDVHCLGLSEVSKVTGDDNSVAENETNVGKMLQETKTEIENRTGKENVCPTTSDDVHRDIQHEALPDAGNSENMEYMTYSAERISQPVALTTSDDPSGGGQDREPSASIPNAPVAPERTDSIGSHTESEGADERRTLASVAAASTIHPFFAGE